MSETRETNTSDREELEKIDLTNLMLDFLHGIRKLWWLIVLLTAGFALQAYLSVSSSYVPQYVASATTAVRTGLNSTSYVNAETAEQMADVFPYILTSGVLQDVVAEDLGMDSVPGSISASAEQGTNFFTISVRAGDPQVAYDILQSVIRNYPGVARYVVGDTTLEVLDETGVPEDTGREITIRGSYRRGAVKGAALGLLILCAYVLTRRTVKSRKELKKHLNLEDFGSIPYVREKKRRKNKNKKDQALSLRNDRVPQGYLEAVRKLRIKVVKEMEEKGYQVLLITSSIPGEGKTTLAANLAISMAKQGKEVILVDCDPRNPSIAARLGETGTHPGLGNILRSKADPMSMLEEVAVSGGKLHVLYGGKGNDKDAKLLGTRPMKNMLEEFRAHADVVILDTAPAELLADASVLARWADAALYVVKYDHARIRRIRNGVQALSASGIDILGYVFNADRSSKSRGYGYGYGYGRYGSYGGYGRYSSSLRQGKGGDDSGRVVKD